MPKKKKSLPTLKGCNYEHQQWVFSKGFVIYPLPFGADYKIVYERGYSKKEYRNGQLFTKANLFQGIWDFYTEIYEHYNK